MLYFSEELIRATPIQLVAGAIDTEDYIKQLTEAKIYAERNMLKFPFTKYKGQAIAEVYNMDPGMCQWLHKVLLEKDPDEYNNRAITELIEELFTVDGKAEMLNHEVQATKKRKSNK